MKKILMGLVFSALAMNTIACGDTDDIKKAVDLTTDIIDQAANCKKTEICKQSEAFSASIKDSTTCEAKATNGTEYIANNSDAMKNSVTEYSGVTEWGKVDEGACSLITIKKIAECAKAMKDTYADVADCESAMTDEQKNAFNSLEDFNKELEKVASESEKASQAE